MIASLGMYDRAETAAANDRFWALIRDALRAKGLAAPEDLVRGEGAYWAAWQDPKLVLSQTCGFPFRARLHDKVTLVATPDYGLEGCPPGYYASVFVARAEDGRCLPEFRQARFAYNEALSQSGWAAPQNHAATMGFHFATLVETGSHRGSALAVAEGRADLAQLIIGRGPRVPTFGKIRSVIDQRGEMFNRQRQLPRRHGLAPAFQQKVHRGRSGFRPFDPDFLFDSPRPFGIGGLQPVKQIIQFDALAKGSRSTEDQRQKCRNDKVVKLCPNFHNRKVAYGAENSSPRRITMERWMSEVISAAVAALAAKMSDGFSAGIAKFVIPGHGAIMIDADGARAGDDEADVTLTAEADVFRAILEGEMNPTAAFMTGKLTVDGSMGLAMQLGAALA